MLKKRWVVYVSGPITAANAWLVEQNIRLAEAVSVQLVQAGVTPICVHSQGRFMDGILEHHEWLEHDLAIVARCDAVVLSTRAFEGSKGTLAEIAEAQRLGLPVFYSVVDLLLHIATVEAAAA